MLTELRIQNFKSWADTGAMRFAPITGFFGANSSGKSSILQFLLMLKQTTESNDVMTVLNLGDERAYIELGTFYDVIHQHDSINRLEFQVSWDRILKGDEDMRSALKFQAEIGEINIYGNVRIALNSFKYWNGNDSVGVRLRFSPTQEGGELIHVFEDPVLGVNSMVFVTNFYSVPRGLSMIDEQKIGEMSFQARYDEYVEKIIRNASDLESLFRSIYYIGPLRSYPERIYAWGGMEPVDVGRYGEKAVQALIASKLRSEYTSDYAGNRVFRWLKAMGLVDEFLIEPIAQGRREYEIRIKKTSSSPYVSLVDVGFGVSQVLPILTLCYHAQQGSVILLEQPELHLHPSAQSVLADFLIEVIKERNLQIVLESHSEHLLRRLQRRIAEEKLSAEDAALYFCEIENGASKLTSLQLDPFGNITNWPKDFFGDEMGELHALTVAGIKRKRNGHESHS
jgi:predicted ATPase